MVNQLKSWLLDAATNPFAEEIVSRRVKKLEIEFYDTHKNRFEMNNLGNNSGYAESITGMKSQLEYWISQTQKQQVIEMAT